MIILQMSGGLGNQMFQYALYLKLKKLGREVKFDDETSYELDNARPVQLAVFDITYPRATRQEVTDMNNKGFAITGILYTIFISPVCASIPPPNFLTGISFLF